MCEDAWNNTYTCLRQLKISNETISTNLIYCEFVDSENYIEVYDLVKDPAQLTNIRSTVDPQTLENLNMEVGTNLRKYGVFRLIGNSGHKSANKK